MYTCHHNIYTNGYVYNYTTLVAKVTADHILADPQAFLVYVAPILCMHISYI